MSSITRLADARGNVDEVFVALDKLAMPLLLDAPEVAADYRTVYDAMNRLETAIDAAYASAREKKK